MKSDREIIALMESSSRELSRIDAQLLEHESRKQHIITSESRKISVIRIVVALLIALAILTLISLVSVFDMAWEMALLLTMIPGLFVGILLGSYTAHIYRPGPRKKEVNRKAVSAQHARSLEELDFKIHTLRGKRLNLVETRTALQAQFKGLASSGGLQLAQDTSTRGGLDLHDE